MSDPVYLAEKNSSKNSKNSTSKKSKKSNATPQQSSEKGEIKSQNSQISKNKNTNNIEQNIQPSQNQEVKPMIEEQNQEQKPKEDNSVPTISVRAYLEQNVTAVVQEALLEVARQRPPNPLQFVGNFILERANAK